MITFVKIQAFGKVNTFVGYVRHPIAPMPAFPASRISGREVKDLSEYMVNMSNRKAE
jgi:mono/diheme cytochrome c family protein